MPRLDLPQILVQQKDAQMFNSSSEDTQKAQFPTYEMVALCTLLLHDFLICTNYPS